MDLCRARYLVSPGRLRQCRALFRRPWHSFLALAFVARGPIPLTLHNGRTLTFSRRGRDQLFWDWYLSEPQGRIEFTAEGEVLLEYRGWKLLLRPGTSDFDVFREVFLQDHYGLQALPARLGTVLDLGGNIGLFSCAVLPRAERVITVEPVLANYRQAARNLAANGGNPTDLLRHALTGRSGEEVAIYLSSRSAAMNSLSAGWVEPGGVLGRETVPSLGLEDLLTRTGCGEVDLLKCDIEGGEFDVFGAASAAVLRRIGRLVVEVHVSPEHPSSALRTLVGRIESAGFDLSVDQKRRRGPVEIWWLQGQRQVRLHSPGRV
jgi:FkbM family methyltransferase